MKSILCVMAIESLAPQVRTVVEVNNPRARRALPARGGRRDPGLVPAGVPADGPLLALPGPGGSGHRHRLGRRGVGALPRPSCPTTTSASRSTSCPPSCVPTTGRRCCRSAEWAVVRQPARGLPPRHGRRPDRGRRVTRHAGALEMDHDIN
jgi:hypothetical protein